MYIERRKNKMHWMLHKCYVYYYWIYTLGNFNEPRRGKTPKGLLDISVLAPSFMDPLIMGNDILDWGHMKELVMLRENVPSFPILGVFMRQIVMNPSKERELEFWIADPLVQFLRIKISLEICQSSMINISWGRRGKIHVLLFDVKFLYGPWSHHISMSIINYTFHKIK